MVWWKKEDQTLIKSSGFLQSAVKSIVQQRSLMSLAWMSTWKMLVQVTVAYVFDVANVVIESYNKSSNWNKFWIKLFRNLSSDDKHCWTSKEDYNIIKGIKFFENT